MRLSTSAFKAWRDCRRRWFFSNRMQLVSQEPQTALFLGSGVHDALGKYYRDGGGLLDEIFQDWAEEEIFRLRRDLAFMWQLYEEDLQAQVTLGKGMLRHYQEWCKPRDDFEVIETEIDFELELAQGLTFSGRMDGIVRDQNGLLWVFEHKTAKDVGRIDWVAYDVQCTGYVWAASQLADSPVAGMLYNFLKKAVPEPPKRLKKGGFSQDKRQPTTYSLYRRALIDAGAPVEGYADILEYLAKQPNPFFRRDWQVRVQPQVDRWLRDMVTVAREMQDLTIYHNDGMHCNWCPYETPCHALMLGADVEAALIGYKVRDDIQEELFLPAAQVDWRSI